MEDVKKEDQPCGKLVLSVIQIRALYVNYQPDTRKSQSARECRSYVNAKFLFSEI